MKKTLIFTLISIIFFSCGGRHTGSNTKIAVDKNEKSEKILIRPEKEGKKETISVINPKYASKIKYPKWFYNPNYGKNIGAIGVAKKLLNGGYALQRRLAVAVARAEMARQLKLSVKNVVTSKKIVSGNREHNEVDSKLQSLSIHKTSQILKSMVVKEEWIDPETKDLYIWMVIESEFE